MLSGWAYFSDKVPFYKKNVAKEVDGLTFEVGVFLRDCGTFTCMYMWVEECHHKLYA